MRTQQVLSLFIVVIASVLLISSSATESNSLAVIGGAFLGYFTMELSRPWALPKGRLKLHRVASIVLLVLAYNLVLFRIGLALGGKG